MPRRRRRKGGARRGKSRLLDKKINTLFERRAQEIAQKEIAKNTLQLIHRKYWFPYHYPAGASFVFNRTTNEFGPGLAIDFDGIIQEMSDIRMADSMSIFNQPVANNALTQEDEALRAAQDGVNVVGRYLTPHGARATSNVVFTGVSLSVKVRLSKVNANVSDYTQDPMIDTTELRYAVISWRSDCEGSESITTGTLPAVENALPWRPWGYSKDLDVEPERQLDHGHERIRTLLRGSVFLKPKVDRDEVKERSHYIKFKRPIELSYVDSPANQQGQNPLREKIAIVFRSNIPDPAGLGAYTEYMPYVIACSKLYYHDAG